MATFVAPESTRTDRFLLRSYLPGDGPALAEAKTGSYDHLSRWLPWAQPEVDVEQEEALVRRFRGRWLLAEEWVVGIWAPDGDRLLGGTDFRTPSGGLDRGTAEIGMWVRVEEAGRGLGAAVLREMVRWGFTSWPWQRLEWRCDAANSASVRTALAAGMRPEGTLRGDTPTADGGRRDTRVFGLLRDDPWQHAGRQVS